MPEPRSNNISSRKKDNTSAMYEGMPTREFRTYRGGSLWTVVDYTNKFARELEVPHISEEWTDEGAEHQQDQYVLKMFEENPRRSIPEYKFDPTNLKSLEILAKRLRAERDYLKAAYSTALPDLFLRGKILVAPLNENQRGKIGHIDLYGRTYKGSIISVQEKLDQSAALRLNTFIDMVLRDDDSTMTRDERHNVVEQLRIFIDTTKELLTHNPTSDNRFTSALPDISHAGNLFIDVAHKPPVLRLIDTDMVFPAHGDLSKKYDIKKRTNVIMGLLEVRLFGASREQLKADKFYDYDSNLIMKGDLATYFKNGISVNRPRLEELGIITPDPETSL